MRVLRDVLAEDDEQRVIETIFSNFNLFPQVNKSNQSNVTSGQLYGIPISYQIANRTMIKANEDLVRFQIRVSEVRTKILKNDERSRGFSRPCDYPISPVRIGHSKKIMVHGSGIVDVDLLDISTNMHNAIAIT